MARVGIGGAGGFAFQGELHLVGGRLRDLYTRLQRAIVGDHDPILVAVFDVDRTAIEVAVVGFKHVEVQAVLRHRSDR